jgi:hypothetical protein
MLLLSTFYISSTFLLKSKVARMAVFFAIDYALCAAFNTGLFVIYRRIQRFGLLKALAADGRFKVVAGQESCTALSASQTVHFSFWFPAFE